MYTNKITNTSKKMIDLRKILVIFVIAILFSILVFSTISAVYQQPEWDDFCDSKPRPVFEEKGVEETITQEVCEDTGGKWNSNWCDFSYYCQQDYDKARERYNFVVFMVSAIFGLIAILVGIYLPAESDTLHEWIGTGFMLGGVFALFFGTARSYSDLHRILRPIVIFIELALVIFISYKKLGTSSKKKAVIKHGNN